MHYGTVQNIEFFKLASQFVAFNHFVIQSISVSNTCIIIHTFINFNKWYNEHYFIYNYYNAELRMDISHTC